MPLTDECSTTSPYRRLGPRFWLPWSAAMVAIFAAFAALFLYARPLLEQPFRAIVMGAGVILVTLAFVGLNLLPRQTLVKRGLEDPMRPAQRRYTWRFLLPMMVYVATLIAATLYWKTAHPTGLAALLVALAPAVPVLFGIRAMMLLLKEETDEYLRSRMLEGWALATGGALAICTVWGFLDQFQVVPHLPLWVVFPIWAVCLAPAQWFLCKRQA
jgi:hypothetical protein